MSNEKLLKEVCNEACSCDAMLGWTCNFCRNLKAKLRQVLKGE